MTNLQSKNPVNNINFASLIQISPGFSSEVILHLAQSVAEMGRSNCQSETQEQAEAQTHAALRVSERLGLVPQRGAVRHCVLST